KHQAFDQKLQRGAATAGSESAAHGELPAARGAAGEEQVRKIHARNEEDCAHGAPKGSERAVQFAGYVVFERHGNQTVFVSATRVGKFHAEVQVGRDAHGVIERLLQRHTWLQATDQGHDVAPV